MVRQLDSEGNGIDQLKLFKFRMHIICLIALNDIHVQIYHKNFKKFLLKKLSINKTMTKLKLTIIIMVDNMNIGYYKIITNIG
mgnify:FL=1